MAHEYTKNLWTNGDVITASKLNSIDDELEELNNDIAAVEQSLGQFAAYTDMSVLNVESSKYIASGSNAGALASTSENVNTYIYDVDGVQFVKIKVTAPSSTYGRYACYSSSSTFTKSTCLQSGTASSNYQILQVPNGAQSLAVCGTTVDVKEISSSDEIYIKQENQLLNFAEPYDPTKVYELNEYCTYGDHFYRRTIETAAAEASWVSNNWTQVSLTGALEETKEEVNNIVDRNTANLAEEYDSTQTYDVGNYVLHNNSIWRCSTAITTPETWTPQHWSLTFIGRELQIIISGGEPNTWDDVQYAVRRGYGSQLYPVGTQFVAHHDTYGDLVFDVVAHNHHKNPNNANSPTMTLMMHNVIPAVFDVGEAFYAVTENNWPNGLPAGTYHFLIPSGFTGNTNNWGGIQFTLSAPIPIGGHILPKDQWSSSSGVISTGRKLSSYSDGLNIDSSVIEASIAIENGTAGVSLGTILWDNDTSNGYMNHYNRARYGSNNWRDSNVRQWLNSNAESNWWTPATTVDRLHATYSDENVQSTGFLYGFDSHFLSVIQPVNVLTLCSTKFEFDNNYGLGTSYTTLDKMFLLSRHEINVTANVTPTEGTALPYYTNLTNNTQRIKYLYNDQTTPKPQILRTQSGAGASNNSVTQLLTIRADNGNTGTSYPNASTIHVAPACVIY